MTRALIATDGFKGTLSARQASEAIAEGLRGARNDLGIDACPIADGGEGTVDAFLTTPGAEGRIARVTGPLGEACESAWAVLPGNVAVVETATTAGLAMVPSTRRDPTRTTTRGLGEAIRAAIDAGACEVIVGLGSSATTDGGCGVASALGWRFLDDVGNGFVPVGGTLGRVARIEPPTKPLGAYIVAMCDVDNPLLGDRGSARVFGPQKGATHEQVERLERGLTHLIEVCARGGIQSDPEQPGSGAAGGLGFGMRAFLHAALRPGFDVVANAIGLRARMEHTDVVITGEGQLDETTLHGKAVFGVARLARAAGVDVHAIVGDVADERGNLMDRLRAAGAPLASVRTLVDDEVDRAEACRQGRDRVRAVAHELGRRLWAG
ncbi:MAG: glycerate kinase [Planctomycetota bacterium]